MCITEACKENKLIRSSNLTRKFGTQNVTFIDNLRLAQNQLINSQDIRNVI